MLDLDLNVEVEYKKVKYPIYFERKNICVHCGAEGSLKFINIFGKEVSREIYPFEYIKCSKCDAIYSIKWEKDEKDGKLYPSAVDKSITKDFLNNFKKKDTKIKELD